MANFEALVDLIDQPGIDSDPSSDIAKHKPDVTWDEALQVQLAVKRRHAAAGDAIVGHQASFTSSGIRKMFPDSPRPLVGTLLRSIVRDDGDEVALSAQENFIESEIGLVLKKDLEGPNLSEREVLQAIDYFVPAIEVAPLAKGVRDGAYSYPHLIAVQKAFGGYVVFGSKHTPATGVDLLLEGCRTSIDGRVLTGATGFEAMGSPLKVVAAMAATLNRIGEKLLAGQAIITGSLPTPSVVGPGNRTARLDFATLGSVTVNFTH